MSIALQTVRPSTDWPSLFRPPLEEQYEAHWRINGYRATIVVWTSEQWERLAERPADAQYYPCGIWCALRMDD
ncbi:MAG TPA: hypothetical protein VG406_18100 [Isosphaeraceae bacterium]|nr:hypothetical protein [Isosphaeraceae bacterium]